jgi:L-seryl-tRNA(Ser) seleniumtransferase
MSPILSEETARMHVDRFGNPFDPNLPYARGRLLSTTEDDFRKLRHAWQIIRRRVRERGPESVHNFTGLDRTLVVDPEDAPFLNDEIAPALFFERFRELAVAHAGGSLDRHDAALLNRVTAGTYATHFTLVKPGDVVVGLSPTHSHASVVRAVGQAGGKLIETTTLDEFADALTRQSPVSLVTLTRLAVTYDLLPWDTVREAIELAHRRGIPVFVDDAGGARIGPVIFDQPRMLGLGVDVGVTGMDKYGFPGPRLGLMVGAKSLVARIRSKASEFGLEARPLFYAPIVRSLEKYRPERVRELYESNERLKVALRAVFGRRLRETPVTAQLLAEDILELAMEDAGMTKPPVVPYEAAAALAMIMLEDHGILSIHFAGLPLGTSTIVFKFIPPEIQVRCGGPEAIAKAVRGSISKVADLLKRPERLPTVLFGDA